MSKTYIKYMPFQSARVASRNARELHIASEVGFETCVFSNDSSTKGLPFEKNTTMICDGSSPISANIQGLKRMPKIIMNFLSVCKKTLFLPNGIWSCHDLGALKIAWIITRFRKTKPTLIYDSHEFEIGRNKGRSARQKRRVQRCEKFLMKRCVFSIMVNDSIADEVQRIHKLEQRPIVVRSIPDYWNIEHTVCKEIRREMLDAFNANG